MAITGRKQPVQVQFDQAAEHRRGQFTYRLLVLKEHGEAVEQLLHAARIEAEHKHGWVFRYTVTEPRGGKHWLYLLEARGLSKRWLELAADFAPYDRECPTFVYREHPFRVLSRNLSAFSAVAATAKLTLTELGRGRYAISGRVTRAVARKLVAQAESKVPKS